MASHDVPVPAEEFDEILQGTRTHVFVDTDDVLTGDIVRALEVANGRYTGREAVGTVQSVSRSAGRLSQPGVVVVSVRWGATSRRASSSARMAVIPCTCGHTKQLHVDAAKGCTLCACVAFHAAPPPK